MFLVPLFLQLFIVNFYNCSSILPEKLFLVLLMVQLFVSFNLSVVFLFAFFTTTTVVTTSARAVVRPVRDVSSLERVSQAFLAHQHGSGCDGLRCKVNEAIRYIFVQICKDEGDFQASADARADGYWHELNTAFQAHEAGAGWTVDADGTMTVYPFLSEGQRFALFAYTAQTTSPRQFWEKLNQGLRDDVVRHKMPGLLAAGAQQQTPCDRMQQELNALSDGHWEHMIVLMTTLDSTFDVTSGADPPIAPTRSLRDIQKGFTGAIVPHRPGVSLYRGINSNGTDSFLHDLGMPRGSDAREYLLRQIGLGNSWDSMLSEFVQFGPLSEQNIDFITRHSLNSFSMSQHVAFGFATDKPGLGILLRITTGRGNAAGSELKAFDMRSFSPFREQELVLPMTQLRVVGLVMADPSEIPNRNHTKNEVLIIDLEPVPLGRQDSSLGAAMTLARGQRLTWEMCD